MTCNTLNINELESFYDRLAEAIDQAGTEHEVIFLTKLALLLANEIGDLEKASAAVTEALKNLCTGVSRAGCNGMTRSKAR